MPVNKQPHLSLHLYRRLAILLAYCLLLLATNVSRVFASPLNMHIAEGMLPPLWALFWYALSLPVWWFGFKRIRKLISEKPEVRLLLGFSGAFVFVLSALKLPSFSGSSSHPTGTALGTILFCPLVMAVLGTIVLLFQALLLAHGGITTLGANSFSMAIGGPLAAWLTWRALHKKLPEGACVFLAALAANLVTYSITSFQLALAFPDPAGGILPSFLKFGSLFVVTQVPLSLSEGFFTMLTYRTLKAVAQDELRALGLMEMAP